MFHYKTKHWFSFTSLEISELSNTGIIDLQQKKIIRLHAQGCSIRKISKLLDIDRRTVKSYVEKYKASGIDPSELIKPEKDWRVPLCLDAQGKLMAMIHEQFKAGQLTLPKSMSTQDNTELKRLMYTKGFNVYA